jgi:hypothetical protein
MKPQSLIIRIRPKTSSASLDSKARREAAAALKANADADADADRNIKNGAHLPQVRIACTRFNAQTWQEYQDWKNVHEQTYEQTYKREMKCVYGSPREISYRKFPPEIPILIIEMNNDANRIMGIGQIQNRTASELYRRPTGAQANANTTIPLPAAAPVQAPATPVQAPAAPLQAHNPAPLQAHNPRSPSLGGGTPPIKYRKIFSDRNYTRYIYIGNEYYATREELERNHTADAKYITKQLTNTIKMPQTPQQHPPNPTTTMIEHIERLLFKGQGHMKRGSGISRLQPKHLI